MPKKVRSIFLSDVHIGNPYAKVYELCQLLNSYETEFLYLVGDIIDGSRMQHQPILWENSYTQFVQKVLDLANSNVKVCYAIGNHDEFLRGFPGCFGNFQMGNEFIHTTADGKRLLITHGDLFDHYTSQAKWLYRLGDKAYDVALFVNKWINELGKYFGFPYWHISGTLKIKISQVRSYINDFESSVTNYMKKKECSGVVCGHVHSPQIRNLGDIQYYNCGDWIEHCTALIEDLDGNIDLIWHHAK